MSRFEDLLGRLADRLNPIVVKELRQAVRGRFLAGVLLFFLALQLLTLGVFLFTQDISSIGLVGGESYGQQVFAFLASILFFATIVCVPVYAALRIYSERADDQMALFFLSTLDPHRIVLGFVHDPHPTAAYLRDDAKLAEPLGRFRSLGAPLTLVDFIRTAFLQHSQRGKYRANLVRQLGVPGCVFADRRILTTTQTGDKLLRQCVNGILAPALVGHRVVLACRLCVRHRLRPVDIR